MWYGYWATKLSMKVSFTHTRKKVSISPKFEVGMLNSLSSLRMLLSLTY